MADDRHRVRRDLTGHRFGRLVVLEIGSSSDKGAIRWWCACDCGSHCLAPTKLLRSGQKRSCGCLSKEVHSESARKRRTTHGQTGTALYQRWQTMIMRCHNPNVKSYQDYGARGVVVCARWRGSYEAFLKDMGTPPTPDMTLERKCNNKGYEPGNVIWATRAAQALNKRSNRIIEWRGESKPLIAWAKCLGISRGLLRDRLRLGWNMDAIASLPPRPMEGRNGQRPLV